MAKQKAPIPKRNLRGQHKSASRALHRKRAQWFAMLAVGLLLIQFSYNIRSGQPQVLGYSTNVNTQALLTDANDYRTQAGLSKLSLNEKLSQAAQAKANDMVTDNYWDHIAPDGTTPWKFIQQANYDYDTAGENLAYGFNTSSQITAAWMNSPEHRDNILGKYSEVGFGVANGKDYQKGENTVVVAMYGAPSGQELSAATAASPTKPPKTVASAGSQYVNGATTIISGNAPWATYASLALLGTTMFGFIITHLETLKLGWRNTRRYAIMHPAADAMVLIGVLLVIVQAAGGFIR
jgi:uncharacterized protein YkwD